jgi:all-trans-retinol 13,14-reductase
MSRAVVIGSGMGGLAAAILLQSHGHSVTVLEQHYRPGGFLHRFHRQGAPFDTGFHYCGGIAAGQPLGQCLRHLGVMDRLDFRPLDPDGFDRLLFPDHEFRVPVGREAYRDRLVAHFPTEEAGIDAVLSEMRAAVEPYSLYRMQGDPRFLEILRWESVTVAEVLEHHISSPMCRAVFTAQGALYGVRPSETPLGMHALILDHLLDGAWSLRGGGDRLALALVRRLRELGGTIRLRTAATAIEVVDRRATGVKVASGEVLPADTVISNLHPRLTLELLPAGAVRPAYSKRVRGQRVGTGHIGVYLRMDGPVPELGRANIYSHRHREVDRCFRATEPGDVSLYFACAGHEQASPLGRRHTDVLTMVLPASWSSFARWADSTPENRPAAYEDYKAQLLESAIDALLADFPSLRGRIVDAGASTPLSTMHYTSSPQGAMYGHHHAIDQMGRSRPAIRLRTKNILLVGQGVGFPGVLGVTLSAYYAAGYILGLNRLLSELRDA